MLDLAIIGGGPAGLAAAIRARQRGLSVAVLSKARGGRARGESLSPAAKPLLQQLECWDDFVRDGHLPCPGNAWCWGDGELRFHSFTRDPRGTAWHVDRSRFDQRLREHAARLGARLVPVRRTPRISGCAGAWTLHPEPAAAPLGARFIIDASGRGASVARGLGARRLTIDPQVAIVGLYTPVHQPLADRTSLVEAVPEGWWYSARTPNDDIALLLFTTRELGAGLMSAPYRLAALLDSTAQTAARARDHRPTGKPTMVDASCEHLDVVAGDGWRAAGDAALTWDPLASHGLTFALASGRDAANSVIDAGGTELAAREYTRIIERARRGYLESRRAIYAAERRWPDSPYWATREAMTRAAVS